MYTDHDALQHLNSQDTMSSRYASWVTYLQQFTFTLKHKSGASNRMVDALSRHHLVLTNMRTPVPGFDLLPELYASDHLFAEVLSHLGDSIDYSYRLVDIIYFALLPVLPNFSCPFELTRDASRVGFESEWAPDCSL